MVRGVQTCGSIEANGESPVEGVTVVLSGVLSSVLSGIAEVPMEFEEGECVGDTEEEDAASSDVLLLLDIGGIFVPTF